MGGIASLGYNPGTHFKTLPIGAGGFVTGINVSTDGVTMVCRNDAGLAYKWDFTNRQWINLTTVATLGTNAYPPWVHEIVVCPSLNSRLYMMLQGFMFRSDDTGNTWQLLTGFTQVAPDTVTFNGTYRLSGNFIAVDPVNPDKVIVGSGANGAFKTINGGTSWVAVTGLPVALPDISTVASPARTLAIKLTVTGAVAGTGGSTRLTLSPGSDGLTVGDTIVVAGALPAGLTGVNGTVTVATIVDATHIETSGTFGGATYTSGGTVVPQSSTVLHFASTAVSGNFPAVIVGMGLTANQVYSLIPLGTTVTAVTSTTVTISNPVTVPNGTSISFSPATSISTTAGNSLTFNTLPLAIANGWFVFNYTHPNTIPAGTTVTGTAGAVVSISSTVTVAAGDIIIFTNPLIITNLYPDYNFAYDPSSSSGGSTPTVYAFPYGSPIYQSTDGGTTWAALTTGPIFSKQMRCGPDGTLWVVSDSQDNGAVNSNVWSYAAPITTSTAPTRYTAAQMGANAAVAIAVKMDDVAPNIHITILGWNTSANNGSTWTGPFNGVGTPTLVQDKIPWIAAFANPSMGACTYVPGTSTVFAVHGNGSLSANPPYTKTTFVMTDRSSGIESLTTSSPFSPVGGPVQLPVWDRQGFVKADVAAYPTANIFNNSTLGIVAGWDISASASDPTFLVGAFNFGNRFHVAFSSDRGNTWQDFPHQPGFVGQGGTIAACSPTNIVYVGSTSSTLAQPYVSTNGGNTWALTDLPSINGWVQAYFDAAHIITADTVTPNTIYIYCFIGQNDLTGNTGVWKSSNGGVNWTKVIAGSSPINAPSLTNIGGFNCRLMAVPGHAGWLMYCGAGGHGTDGSLFLSTDGAMTWNSINANLNNLSDFNFGKAFPSASDVAIYTIASYNSVFGIWRSTDFGANFTQLSDGEPLGNLVNLSSICGDQNLVGRGYFGIGGNGFGYFDYISG